MPPKILDCQAAAIAVQYLRVLVCIPYSVSREWWLMYLYKVGNSLLPSYQVNCESPGCDGDQEGLAEPWRGGGWGVVLPEFCPRAGCCGLWIFGPSFDMFPGQFQTLCMFISMISWKEYNPSLML